ncbi:hypothetical protein BASA60_002649 [Batrachochytrium salamandrivorans]|nr:hypothetical protein BASA60_002649 [Batrachochytrium salamandrivorans]
MLISSLIALLAIGSTSVSATNYAKCNLLKDDRAAGRLVFPPTTLAQKEVILSNVESALAIWASYKSKKAKYGSAADPFPTIKDLRENIKTITDKDLQLRLTDAFAMIRDQHTRWTTMAPYSCFYATTEVEFTFIEGDVDITNKPTVVVTSTAKHPKLLALFGEDYSKIQAGDELLAINGLSFVRWFKQNKFKYGFGANDFGGQRAALKYLTTISGKINRLPSDDSINFKFKSRANPQNSHTVNVPYVSGRDEECWELGSNCTRASLVELFLEHLKRVCLLAQSSLDTITKSANMGIIKLDSFDPEEISIKGLAVEKAVMIIRSLLVNELKDTKSVMYDLRGNSGGSIRFANSLVQCSNPIFSPLAIAI